MVQVASVNGRLMNALAAGSRGATVLHRLHLGGLGCWSQEAMVDRAGTPLGQELNPWDVLS